MRLGKLMMDSKALTRYERGLPPREVRFHYHSWSAAFAGLPDLAPACQKRDCTRATLMDRITEVCPNLVHAPLHVRPGLSPEHIKRRQEVARQLVEHPPQFGGTVVSVDETKIARWRRGRQAAAHLRVRCG
jgi:hypothetical protein